MINKLFKNKNKRYLNLCLVLLPFILLIALFGFITIKSTKGMMSGTGSGTSYSSSIDQMNYHLRANATNYQKELFTNLQKAVESNDKAEIVKQLGANYVADFYTWSNKSGSYDVGGMYYVYSPHKAGILANVRDTYYKYVTHYINEYGSENLPEVEKVEVTGAEKVFAYELEDKTFDAWGITVEWQYKAGSKVDTSDLVTKIYLTIIENADGRFEIVQAYGDF